MSYNLNNLPKISKKPLAQLQDSLNTFSDYLPGEKLKLTVAVIAVLVNSGATIVTPYLISLGIDNFISKGDLNGLTSIILILSALYLAAVVAGYLQARIMGLVSQRTLYRLRNHLFAKIQSLPISFFNQNKSGDLISRLNSDTEKINDFLSQSFLRFIATFASIVGIGIFIFFINWQMALVTLFPTILIFISTRLISPWVQRVNKEKLEAAGQLSAEVQESLTNFKAIIAFNRQEYFKQKFVEVNEINYQKSVLAEVASGVFNPLYNFVGNIAQVMVLGFGIYLISKGQLTVGLLIGFVSYTQKFYEPLRILGTIWGTLQSATAAWVRVREILGLESNLKILKS